MTDPYMESQNMGTSHLLESSSYRGILQLSDLSQEIKNDSVTLENFFSTLPTPLMCENDLKSCSRNSTNIDPHSCHGNCEIYNCGGCLDQFENICDLHLHLQGHNPGGSYIYNHALRTAFPKYDTVCRGMQTEEIMFDSTDYGNFYSEQYNDTNDDEDSETNVYNIKTQPHDDGVALIGSGDYDGDTEANSSQTQSPPGLDTLLSIADVKFGYSARLNVGYGDTEQNMKDKVEDSPLVEDDLDQYHIPQFTSLSETNSSNILMEDTEETKANNFPRKSNSKKMIKKVSKLITLDESDTYFYDDEEQAELDDTSIKIVNPFYQLQKLAHNCNKCEQQFHNKLNLIEHIKSKHLKDKNKIPYYVYCKTCKGGFFKKSKFKTHECQPFSLKCHECDEEFFSGAKLRKHIVAQHKPFKCDLCDKVLCSQTSLKNHMMMHRGEKPIQCSVCEKPFRTKANLQKHLPIHTGVKSAVCEYCGKGFYHRNLLLQHVKQCRGDKPYQCTQCEMAFSFKHFLTTHMRKHTGEKPFVCEVCGVAFARADEYRHHKYVHTGEKPYQCSMCDKKFSRFNSRQKHERTHTLDKPYKCGSCEKAFTSSWNCKVHMRQHTGEKPYKCEVCGAGFTHNVSRKTHMKTHILE